MKRLYLFLVLMLAVLISGCGKTNNSSSSSSVADTKGSVTSNVADTKASTVSSNEKYTIEKATYKDKNIQINYPQISNLSNSDQQKKINQIIKSEALAYTNDYKDSIANLDFKLDFQVKYKGTDFLSIVYLGLAHVKDTPYPTNVIYTCNIDLIKAETLVLDKVAKSADEKLASTILAGKYKTYSSDLNLESADALKQVLKGYDSHSLMLILKQSTSKFYLTKDSLGISMEVIHALGDHFEMEVDYKSLGDLLSIKPKGSEDASADKSTNSSNSSNVAATSATKSSDELVNKVVPKELVQTICLSEALHYNSFNGQPDETTTNYLLADVVSKKLFRWSDILKVQDGAYYFSNGPESESATKTKETYVSPNTLYKDYFESGKYVYPPQELSRLVGGTQTGIMIKTLGLPFTEKVVYKSASQKGDLLTVNVTLSRVSKLSGEIAPIGDAVITLKDNGDTCYFGYKIVSFEPKYQKFENVKTN